MFFFVFIGYQGFEAIGTSGLLLVFSGGGSCLNQDLQDERMNRMRDGTLAGIGELRVFQKKCDFFRFHWLSRV